MISVECISFRPDDSEIEGAVKAYSGTLFTTNKELGDIGIRINEVTLYSASAVVKYAYPKGEVEIDAYDEVDNVRKTADFEEPPELIGVKLKDETLLANINDGGSSGYENGNMNEFVALVNFFQILEKDEIDSLLFIKEYPEIGKIKNYRGELLHGKA